MAGNRQTNAATGTTSCKADKAKPCDVSTFSMTVTDGMGKSHTFSTDKSLKRDAVPAGTPEHAARVLRTMDFYVEVLGSGGAPGGKAKHATASATAAYVGGCGRVEHSKPLLLDSQHAGIQQITGSVLLSAPPDFSAYEDAGSVLGSASHGYTVMATACGRRQSVVEVARRPLMGKVAVFTPQDWSLKLSSPAGWSFGFSKEGGITSSSSYQQKTLGAVQSKTSSSRDVFGKSSKSSGERKNGLYSERTTEVTTTDDSQSSSTKYTVAENGFFTRREIAEKIEHKSGGPYERKDLTDKTKLDMRGTKLEILRNGESVVDSKEVIEDFTMAMDAIKDVVDVLKGLPKAGYWIEGSATFLAISLEGNWKRKAAAFTGPRTVCLGNQWKLDLSGQLVKADLTVGAGVKLQAMSSLAGGVELYAYLSGSLKLSVSANIHVAGERDPEQSKPSAPAKGTLTFEAGVHGQASVAGAGWRYQRTASIQGKIEATPKMITGGAEVTLVITRGQWRYKVVAQTDWLGRPEEYEINDLFAWSPTRLSEKEVAAKEDNPGWKRTSVIQFRTGSPYLQATWS